MKICLLGEFSGNLDEGMRKISFYMTRELSKRHQVLNLDLRTVFRESFWKSVRDFEPQIIHYVHGGSPKSFTLLRLISLRTPYAKTVMSVMRPDHFSRFVAKIFKPGIILVQSKEAEKMFKRICKTIFFPSGGVDVERFAPVVPEVKSELREKYGIEKDKFVILHVGSIKSERNVQFLKKLQTDGNQVIIVGPTSTGVDEKVYRELKKSGVIIWTTYFERIEEIYALSDCYVFPVIPKKNFLGKNVTACIDVPLSVLEAMASNLPVITTSFGALPRMFSEGDGLFFAEREEEFITTLNKIKRNEIDVKTREKVMPYSWENIGKKLENIYLSLIG